MHHHGSCAYTASLLSVTFVCSATLSGGVFNFETFNANSFRKTSENLLQGWKLAWDEFLNKSHQASHARQTTLVKCYRKFLFSLQIPPPSKPNVCRLQTNCGSKRIQIIDTKWWHFCSRQLNCVRVDSGMINTEVGNLKGKICFCLRNINQWEITTCICRWRAIFADFYERVINCCWA